ncbi:MAG TPA: AAA family ATPase [Gemmataceae bacterium]|nr:AAA family ATPase [Gemmataceae bacterium]
MNDTFAFLKDLVASEPEVIAAFCVGVVAGIATLGYPFYRFIAWFYDKRIENLESDLKRSKDALVESTKEVADAKKKAKDRKSKLEQLEAELVQSKSKLTEAEVGLGEAKKHVRDKDVRYAERMTKYNDVVRQHNRLVKLATSLKKQVASLNEQAKLVEKLQRQLWDMPVDIAKTTPFRPLTKGRAAIIAVINLKGGVGKTTLTANLAATYCQAMNKRVLAIDLDFQASLTHLCLPASLVSELQIGTGHLVDNVFADGLADAAQTAFSNMSQTREPKLRLLATTGKLANVEEQAKAKWLMTPGASDVRCLLRSALHAPVFQDNFDVVLIDCPPRWTTSSINAIACCDYVLIPTLLDRVSSEAVPRLLRWLRDLKSSSAKLYGNFRILGVVGNRAYPRAGLVLQEREIWKELPGKCEQTWLAPVHHFATIVHDKSEIRRAANSREFAASHPDLQPVFLDLVNEIEAGRSQHECP